MASTSFSLGRDQSPTTHRIRHQTRAASRRQRNARKNYAGTSPITLASGTKKIVLTPTPATDRDAPQRQAFCSMRGSPGATAYYQQLRARNIGHHATLRQLANRLVGILHGCLKTHTTYDEHTAWTHIHNPTA